MAEILDKLSILIEDIIAALGYPGITLVMFLENIFPPIPSEIVMPFAGFLVADNGEMTFPGIVIAGTLGSVLGALVIYYVGVWADDLVIRRFIRRYGRYFTVSEQDLDRALSFFDRYGEAIVFFGRLIPIIRSLISLPAGMKRMPLRRFLLFTALGTAIWTALLSAAGVILKENWEDILTFIDTYQMVTLVVVGAAVLVLVIRRYWSVWTHRSHLDLLQDGDR
ncbi:MAG: DedA family protein [Chloroflexi bacterium]|nr:DedA family protein [Chloroflexota bacterium]